MGQFVCENRLPLVGAEKPEERSIEDENARADATEGERVRDPEVGDDDTGPCDVHPGPEAIELGEQRRCVPRADLDAADSGEQLPGAETIAEITRDDHHESNREQCRHRIRRLFPEESEYLVGQERCEQVHAE